MPVLLNRAEKALVNSPVRAAVQRRFEAPRLLDLGGPVRGGHALEVGCGRGVGVEIILERFCASTVDAFDLDPEMVTLAKSRLDRYGDRVRLWTGDATAIEADDASYDAVFDFGTLHHVFDWRAALSEIHRVLKPGGRFYAEEVFAKLIDAPLVRRVFDHPDEDRFDGSLFRQGLRSAGFKLRGCRHLWRRVGWFVADRCSDSSSSPSRT